MAERRERAAIAFVPVAGVAGVVAGHWLAYAVTFSDGVDRSTILTRTGHGYWSAAVAMAVVCGAIAAATAVAHYLARGLRHLRPVGWFERFGPLALRLAATQLAVFVLQETLERVLTGSPVSGLGRDGFLVVGILAQVLVALVSSAILTWLGRTAESLARARSGRRSVPLAAVRVPLLQLFLPRPADRGAVSSRAPPRAAALPA